jgi:hypothetical protein
MLIFDLIITVFCLIDDEYKKLPIPIRKGKFFPVLFEKLIN